MVSSISSSYSTNSAIHQSQQMTNEQKEVVTGIFSKYEASGISKEDFQSMMDEIKKAGIKPSEDLKKAIISAGFEMPAGSGPKGIEEEVRSKPPEFKKLMEKLKNSDITEEEVQTYIKNLKNDSNKISGSIMDNYA